jgi:hypothetical protein
MSNLLKSAALGAAILSVVAIVDTASAQTQLSALPPSSSTPVIQLPSVNVLGYVPPTHFQAPPGYDTDVSMHPYTSGIGPCPEGASPSQGCHHDTGHPIPPSHYNDMAWFK